MTPSQPQPAHPRQPVLARRRLLRGSAAAVALPALGYGGAVALLWAFQERLLFQPEPWPAGLAPGSPASGELAAPDVRHLRVPVPGDTLSALHLQRPGARGLVFFLHGNGGNLASWAVGLDFWRRAGWDLFMLDYRGYGLSTGRITSEEQLHDDVQRSWELVSPHYAGRPCVLYGRSLGCGLAARLAVHLTQPARRQAHLLVLVSPYASLTRLAAEQYPWIPGFALRYPLRTDRWLPAVRMPIWIAHGEDDRLIPIAHAERLVALHPQAELLRLPGTGHADVHLREAYRQGLRQRLDAL